MRRSAYVPLILTLFLSLSASISAAHAEAGTLVVTFSGEAYDGAPQFVLKFNGTDIGAGVVDTSIDTAKSGRLRDVPRIEPYLETFEFSIPDGVFDPNGSLQVLFPNDAYGGDGLDRNLVIYSAVLNGRAIGPNDISVTAADGAVQPHELILDRVVLASDGLVATISAPASGWPRLEPVPAASVQAVDEATEPPPTSEETPPASELPASASEVPATPSAPKIAEVAPEPEAPLAPVCKPATIAVTGFGRGLINVPVAAGKELQAFVEGLGEAACRVQVTGYSSFGGNAEINSNLAKARAAAVLDYLKQKGASFAGEEVISKGETNEFGPAAADNQRVLVSVSP